MTAGAVARDSARARAGAGEGAVAVAGSQTGSKSSQAAQSRVVRAKQGSKRLARLDSQAEGFVYSSNLSAAFSLPTLPLPLLPSCRPSIAGCYCISIVSLTAAVAGVLV